MTVTVFTKPACQQCNATKKHLTKLGVPFTAVDVTTDPDAKDEVTALGYSALPVVHIRHTDGSVEHWGGFRPDRLKGLAA